MHQVGDHARGRARLACVTVTKMSQFINQLINQSRSNESANHDLQFFMQRAEKHARLSLLLPLQITNDTRFIAWTMARMGVHYLPVHEYGTSVAYRVTDEAYSARQVLTNVFPRNVHHVEDFVRDFLFIRIETRNSQLMLC